MTGADACGGPRPSIESCTLGAAWAECNGAGGEPRFACSGGGCFWFAGGCLASGYVESPRPPDDLCCVPTTGPIAGRGWTGVGSTMGVATLTVGWGTQPWDRARDATLDVHVGATSDGARPHVECTSSAAFAGVCTSGEPILGRLDGVAGAWVVRLHDNRYAIASTEVFVEIIPGVDTTPTARVCIVPTTDYAEAWCQTAGGRACAVSGTVTIPSFPTTAAEAGELAIDVDAIMPDGTPMVLRL